MLIKKEILTHLTFIPVITILDVITLIFRKILGIFIFLTQGPNIG